MPLEWADRYKGVFDEGYEAIRAGILARQIELGLLPEGTELSPINPHGEPERTGPDGQPWPLLDTVRPWDSLNDDEKRLFVRMAEVFAGYISYYDDRLGRVLDYLEESGELDNTIIVVVSDNGASGEGGPNGSFNEWRFFNGVADTAETTLPHLDELGTPASNNHYNTGWAWALDTPFPYWKRWAGAEGGVADMCIVSWPAQDRRRRASRRQQYIHAVDVVPTIYDLLGIDAARGDQGLPAEPDRGRELRRRAHRPRRCPASATQFYAMLGQRSIYHEGWLACTVHPPLSGWGNFEQDEWELFHLDDRPLPDHEPRRPGARAPRAAEGPVVLLRRAATTGCPLDDRSALEQVLAERPRAAAPRDQYVFYPNCADVPESAGPAIPGRSYTIAAGVDRRLRRRRGRASGPPAASPAVTASTSRTGASATRSTGSAPRSRTSSPTATSPPAPTCSPPSSPPPAPAPTRPCPAPPGTLTLYVDDQAVGSGDDRHPARLLLPHRRRHLRRPRQRLGGHPRVPGTVPVHRRHDRQGRRRRLRRALRRPRGPGPRLVLDRLNLHSTVPIRHRGHLWHRTKIPDPDVSRRTGRAVRSVPPRTAHAELNLRKRAHPVDVLIEQAAFRVSDLVPLRHGRMLDSNAAIGHQQGSWEPK